MESGVRCAAHPARPAQDRCPSCDRPRCAADRARDDRCAVCDGAYTRRVRPPLDVLAGTAVVAVVGAVAGAALGQEYVGARVFSIVFPALIGIVLAAVAVTWTGPLHPRLRHLVATVTTVGASLSALLDFRFTEEPFGPVGRWLPPLVAAAVAAAVGVEALARRALSRRA